LRASDLAPQNVAMGNAHNFSKCHLANGTRCFSVRATSSIRG
jgi:hypothetical protein